jgi:uncharacterized protein YqeY
MDIRQKLDTELKDAMRSGDEMRKQNVRMILSAIRLLEVEKGQKLDEAGIIAIIRKEVKSRSEALEDAKKANRNDLVEQAMNEAKYLESFLPRQLSEDELEGIIHETIHEIGATSGADMGKVMKAVMPKVQGLAPGELVSRLVRKILPQ